MRRVGPLDEHALDRDLNEQSLTLRPRLDGELAQFCQAVGERRLVAPTFLHDRHFLPAGCNCLKFGFTNLRQQFSKAIWDNDYPGGALGVLRERDELGYIIDVVRATFEHGP